MGAAENENHNEESGRTMLYWLGRELRLTREKAGLKMLDVVIELRRHGKPCSESKLSRFETGQNYPREDLDAIIAAYAMSCGVADGREIWRRALKAWLAIRGAVPVLGDLTPQARAMLLAEEAKGAARARRAAAPRKPPRARPESSSRSDAGVSPEVPSTTARRRRAR